VADTIDLKELKRVAEFGDFQTPPELASKVCEVVSRLDFQPTSLIEPTCGIGGFLVAALEHFPSINKAVGVDIADDYVKLARSRLAESNKTTVIQSDFFETNWSALQGELSDPLLVLGNPPWVTNTRLSTLGSSNVPVKTNFQKLSGLAARTGKSNFDISEWMLLRVLHWLENREATMAMLCKTAVARKLLGYAWKNNLHLSYAAIHAIDARKYFNAAVDACLLVCKFSPHIQSSTCYVFESLEATGSEREIGMIKGNLVASVESFRRWEHLFGESSYKWRSGIKHDCSKVMELTKEGKLYRNGFGNFVELEDACLYPMLKSSDVANGLEPTRWMLVPQKSVHDDTASLEHSAPKTWNYLLNYANFLDKRGSSIYKKRPRFSIFGVGDYSFSPWKVAISGLYKKLSFHIVGNDDGKPTVLDDTCYFLSFETKEEAEHIADLLNSQTTKEFLESFIFWDAKRPITVDILQRLNLTALESELFFTKSI
jgi:hypothetical protein